MESEDDILFGDESGQEMDDDDDDDDFVGMEMDPEAGSAHDSHRHDEEDFPFEVLTTEQIVQHMVDCIKEVNAVVEVRFFIPCSFFHVSVKLSVSRIAAND